MASPAYRAAVFAQTSDDPTLMLVELTHPDLDPVRVVGDAQPVTHLGQTYLPAGFAVSLPEEGELTARARISIENVDRSIVAALRAAEGAPRVTIKAVLASQPDVIDEAWPDMQLLDATYDAAAITGELGWLDLAAQAFGAEFNPADWSGLR